MAVCDCFCFYFTRILCKIRTFKNPSTSIRISKSSKPVVYRSFGILDRFNNNVPCFPINKLEKSLLYISKLHPFLIYRQFLSRCCQHPYCIAIVITAVYAVINVLSGFRCVRERYRHTILHTFDQYSIKLIYLITEMSDLQGKKSSIYIVYNNKIQYNNI